MTSIIGKNLSKLGISLKPKNILQKLKAATVTSPNTQTEELVLNVAHIPLLATAASTVALSLKPENINADESVALEEITQSEQTNSSNEPVLSSKEVAENKYFERCSQVMSEIDDKDTYSYYKIDNILKALSYTDKDGNPVLSEHLYTVFNQLLEKDEDKIPDRIAEIVSIISEKDENNEPCVNNQLLAKLFQLQKKYKSLDSSILEVCETYKKANCLDAGLDFVNNLYDISAYHIRYLARKTINPDKTFNKELADFYHTCTLYKQNIYDIENLEATLTEVKDGKIVVKPYLSIVYKILDMLQDKNSSKGIYGSSCVKDIAKYGCAIEDYLQYYDEINRIVMDDRDLYFDMKLPDPLIISLCINERPIQRFGTIEYQKFFNTDILESYKKYHRLLATNPEDYSDKKKESIAIGYLVKACTLQGGKLRYKYFDENLMEKAIELMESNSRLSLSNTMHESEVPIIAEIINRCKKVHYDAWVEGQYSVIFDEELFKKAEEKLQEYSAEYVLDAMDFCKEKNNRDEEFNLEAFDLYFELKNHSKYDNFIKRLFKAPSGYPSIRMQLIKDVCEIPDICDYFIVSPDSNDLECHISYEKINLYKEVINILKKQAQEPDTAWLESYHLEYFTVDGRERSEIDFGKASLMKELLKSGLNKDSLYHMGWMNYDETKLFKKLYDEGIDEDSAAQITKACIKPDGTIDEKKLSMSYELYNIGIKPPTAWQRCYDRIRESIGILGPKEEFNEIAYDRLKKLREKELPIELISTCREQGLYKDRLYKLLINLYEQGFSAENLNSLMNTAFNPDNTFNQNTYNCILELKKLGIAEEKIAPILKLCKNKNIFSEDTYKKVLELKHKGAREEEIEKILNASRKNSEFLPERYEEILRLIGNYNSLKDATYNTGEKVIQILLEHEDSIKKTSNAFGEDIFNYAVALKATGYKRLAENGAVIINNCPENFTSELKERLDLLPSPELKVKRLISLGALAKTVSTDALYPLMRMIESPRMSDAQKEIVNKIFSDDSLNYDTQIEMFVEQLNVPGKNKNYIVNYLKKARLDKQVQRPGTIEEQMKQMDEYAQQMLTNPKIPLEKKIKYIDEFKNKKADMQANPLKYTTPRLFPKVMNELQKVVEAYINIPNADIKFNGSIYETMYRNSEIETTPALLERIKYDAKYFDKLLTTTSQFKTNFKRLIELVKMNPDTELTEMRMMLPDINSPNYQRYAEIGLLEQIQVNLDTKRQFEERDLDFEKWNSYDKTLCGEDFNVEIDTTVEFDNLINNITNELQGVLINKIKPEELENFYRHLSQRGFTIINNKILFQNQTFNKNLIASLINTIISYSNTSKYWTAALNQSSDIPASEIDSINGFMDHINGFKRKYEEIQSGKSISNLHLTLSNPNDIGRNIFFGDHVGCCNSVSSTYAGYSAPLHLMNAYVRGIEIVDEYGNSFGNSLCYFANIDGQTTFVIDSFEANGKLASNPIVTEKIIEFAKQVCRKIASADIPIVFGPRYNHLDLSCCEKISVDSFKVIGSVSERTYCDTAGGKVSPDAINNTQIGVEVHSL